MRRWRAVIAAGVLVGVVVGWVSATGPRRPSTPTFRATHTLLVDPRSSGGPTVYRAAALATLGAVPTRVATRLGIDRQLVQSRVYTESTKVGLLLVIARSTIPAQAEALADVTAEELIVELGGQSSPLRTLEPAVASPIETDDVKAPSSRPGRALLLGSFGLFLGICAAFAVDRFDNRIRSKSAAEDALGVPVIGEVPSIPRMDRDRLLTPTEPSSLIEAYRGLRTSVDRWATQPANDQRIIVVTSPTGGEGKTTTVAHLAATLGEVGRSVVAISADLRRPRLHLYLGKAREPGLTDVLRGAPDTRNLTDLNLATTIRGVRFVASGTPVRNPSPLLDHIGEHLRDARALGDYVLIDAPPLLTTSESADLARYADGVLLVVRAGRTSVGAAARSIELLERLEVPVIGAVLVCSGGQI